MCPRRGVEGRGKFLRNPRSYPTIPARGRLRRNDRGLQGIDGKAGIVDNYGLQTSSRQADTTAASHFSTMTEDLWTLGCARLAAELPEQQFNTWIRPLPAPVIDHRDEAAETVVELRVPNRFKLDWIRTQYATRIQTLLSEIAGRPVRLEIGLNTRDAAPAPRRPASADRPSPSDGSDAESPPSPTPSAGQDGHPPWLARLLWHPALRQRRPRIGSTPR